MTDVPWRAWCQSLVKPQQHSDTVNPGMERVSAAHPKDFFCLLGVSFPIVRRLAVSVSRGDSA